MPPLIIVKGKTHKSLYSYDTSQGPKGTIWTWQEKAWTDDVLGTLWFKNIFLARCGPTRPQLLILDGHHSHEVSELIESAAREHINIMTIPPHTSHWLQPLNKGCFSALIRSYNQVCSEFMAASPQNVVTKANWPSLFAKAWDQSMTDVNMKAGFRVSGIMPFDRNVIPKHAYAPAAAYSLPLGNEASSQDKVPASNTPPPPTLNACTYQ
jgi:hypothetical protein